MIPRAAKKLPPPHSKGEHLSLISQAHHYHQHSPWRAGSNPHYLKPFQAKKEEISSEKQENQLKFLLSLSGSNIPAVLSTWSRPTGPQNPTEMWLPARQPHTLRGRPPNTPPEQTSHSSTETQLSAGLPAGHLPGSPLLTAGTHRT